jgi:hypothetical protein
MNIFTLPNIVLIASASSILLALSLAGGSLSKSVKWNLYNSGTNYGVKGGPDIYYFYHGFELKAFEGRHNIIVYILLTPLNDGVSLRVYFIIFSFPSVVTSPKL